MSAATQSVSSGASLRKPRYRGTPAPYLFVAPFVLLFVVFMLAPMVVAIYQSFFTVKRSGLGFTSGRQTMFAGISNYVTAFHDHEFMTSFLRVLMFGVIQVPIMIGLSLIFALLIDSTLVKFKKTAQIIVFLPYAVPVVVAAILWGFLYQPGVSPIVKGLKEIGITVNLLSPQTVLWAVGNVTTWCWVGVNMIIIFAGLQSISQDIYEAARIDGAGELRIAWSIKIPMVMPSLMLTVLFSIIGTIQLFNEPSVLKSITGNVTAEYTPAMAIVNVTSQQNNQNLGAAMAVITAVVTLILSLIVSMIQKYVNQKETRS